MLDRVWHCLPRVCRVCSASRVGDREMTFEADVFQTPGPGAATARLDWLERGHSSFLGRRFPGVNAYRFDRREHTLHVAHLRFGPQNPVPLVVLHASSDALVSTSPHVCGHDLYSLQIFPEPDALVMRWWIQSPDATAHITSTYALRSAPLRSPASAC
ncbi:MAG: hypothetical protein GC200_06785 [Tepidisphaera sp.]|nr:hypothetical protein [Tepidisphaera sp.]